MAEGRGRLHKIKVNMLKCCQCFKMPERCCDDDDDDGDGVQRRGRFPLGNFPTLELNFKSILKRKENQSERERALIKRRADSCM